MAVNSSSPSSDSQHSARKGDSEMSRVLARLEHALNFIRCKRNPVAYARSIGVRIGANTRFYGASPGMFSTEPWLISIGDNVHITDGVKFLTHDGGTLILEDEVGDFVLTGNITVGDNTYIGINTVILPGVTIGRDCIIGACSVVTRSVPDGTVAAGVPARAITSTRAYAEKVKAVMAGDDSRYYSDLGYMHSLNPARRSRASIGRVRQG